MEKKENLDTIPKVDTKTSTVSTDDNKPSTASTDENLNKERIKKQGFDRETRQFIKQAQETIQSKYGSLIELGQTRPELVCLNKYFNIYNSMMPEEHYCYFEQFYGRHRSQILNILQDDSWLKKKGLAIQFGEGIKTLADKCKPIRIMVSDIYILACELQQTAEKALDGIDEKFAQGGKDLIRPSILLLHLLRIFYYINDTTDKPELAEILSKLEEDLGIPVERRTLTKTQTSNSKADASESEDGLSSIFSMATNMMEKMGYQPPAGMKGVTNKEITQVINKVFMNPATQGAIETLFSSMQGCNDLNSAIQTVVKNVTDPATMNAIQDSVISTSQMAAQMPSAQSVNNT
jgi:hypothetical protein